MGECEEDHIVALFGNKFTMYTDHKPVLGLFAENSALPTRAASRVLRWPLLLSAYNYELCYREGGWNGNADALSRLPLDARTGKFSEILVSVATQWGKYGSRCRKNSASSHQKAILEPVRKWSETSEFVEFLLRIFDAAYMLSFNAAYMLHET